MIVSAAISIILQGMTSTPHVQAPHQLTATFATLLNEIEFLGICLDPGDGDRTDARYEQLERRYWTTRREAIEIWGAVEPPDALYFEDRRRCGKARIRTALDNANANLTDVEQSLSLAATRQRTGAWVGAFRLCRDTVSQMEIIVAEWNGEPALRVTVTTSGRSALFNLTVRAVADTLAVRVDGRVVSRPSIHEPLQGDTFHIQARDPHALDRIRTAAMGVC